MVRKNIKRVLVLSTVAAFVLIMMAALAILIAPPPLIAIKTPKPEIATTPELYPGALNYKYPDLKSGLITVPRYYISDIPGKINTLPTKEKKRIFTNAVLPLILKANELILEDRERATALVERIKNHKTIKKADQNWFINLLKRYKFKTTEGLGNINFELLFNRLDVIPPSLAIAQAAIESGWGSSRFAQQGNALYGQWTWGRGEAEGMVPKGRETGETHSIRSFRTPMESVLGYVSNLNTHSAYTNFRDLRAYARVNGYKPSGIELAETLISYSTRKENYILDLKNIIYINNFLALDEAKLLKQSFFQP